MQELSFYETVLRLASQKQMSPHNPKINASLYTIKQRKAKEAHAAINTIRALSKSLLRHTLLQCMGQQIYE